MGSLMRRRLTKPSGIRLAAAIGVLALVMAACGSNNDDGDGGEDPAAEGTEEPAPTDSPDDDDDGDDSASGDAEAEDDPLAELVAAATEEGELILYSNMVPTLVESMVTSFEETYPGIDVTAERMITGDLLTRVEAEIAGDLSVVDVVQHNEEGFYEKYCADGTIADISDLPIAELWDNEVTDSDKWDGCRSVPKAISWGMMWNTENVSPDEVPTSFEDLADERWRDRIILVDPAASPNYLYQFSLWVDDYGWEFLDQLRELNPAYSGSSPTLLQEVSAGAYDIMCCSSYEALVPLVEEGAPLEGLFPEGSLTTQTRSGVLANAPNPNAARLFMNWSMSPEGQEVITFAAHSQLPGIPSQLDTDVTTLRSVEPGEKSDPNSEFGLQVRDRLGRP